MLHKIYYKFRKYHRHYIENRINKIQAYNTINPIYHIHIRKTAGTTINYAFLYNSNKKDLSSFYESLARKENHRLISNKKIFVGWNKNLIEEGKYFYAFSHIPYHDLNLPKNVFKFTCFRDPIKRLISHYNMLVYYQKNNINHPIMATEGEWLNKTFNDFIKRIPREHLCNQLYMFSKEFNIDQAYDNILSCDSYMFTEDLQNGLESLGDRLNLKLPISNQKQYGFKADITNEDIQIARELLESEYRLFDRLKLKK